MSLRETGPRVHKGKDLTVVSRAFAIADHPLEFVREDDQGSTHESGSMGQIKKGESGLERRLRG